MSKICSLQIPLQNGVAQLNYESLGDDFESRHGFYLYYLSKKNVNDLCRSNIVNFKILNQ